MQTPAHLRCEYLVDPMGIDVQDPRLSWEVRDARRSVRQVGYQILVASNQANLDQGYGDLWDSGRVTSDETMHVVYQGQPLESRMRCYWKVRVWLRAGNGEDVEDASPWSEMATWSMGLLQASDWTGRWIGDPSPLPEPLPPHHGYRSEPATSPDESKWVVIDLKAPSYVDGIRLFGTRVLSGHPSRVHGDILGFLFPLRFRIDVSDRARFADFRTVVDCTSDDVPNPGVQSSTYRFDPVVARFVRLFVTRLRADNEGRYGVALSELEVLFGERNLAQGASVSASDCIESDLWSVRKLNDGDIYWHPGGPVKPLPSPMLRREFVLTREVRRATAYATALGLYELQINGQSADDRLFAPEFTDYRKCVNYQTYDVTERVRQGGNAIGVRLGDGWYAGRIGMIQAMGPRRLRGCYGRKPRFKMQLEVEYVDGESVTLVTDGSWRSTVDGPIRRSDIYDGEVYDARRSMSGWDRPGFNDVHWQAAEEGLAEEIVDGAPQIEDVALIAQMTDPIRVQHELPAQRVFESQSGVYIFDIGQNIVGRVRMKVRGKPGQHVTLRHSEMLTSDGALYTAYLRGAFQDDQYILHGDAGGEFYEPHFTFHGFRYVEVCGLGYEPRPEDLVGRAFYSSPRQSGFLETSNPLANKIWENALWTQRGNLQGVIIDCPQRDERLPWVCGDFHSFAHTALYNMDMAALIARKARDVRQAQYESGGYPNLAPNVLQMGCAPGWGDEGVLLPWIAYLHYGDRRLLEEHFASAKRYVGWIQSQCPGLIWNAPGPGDWLNADTIDLERIPSTGAAVPQDVFSTAFFAYSARLIAKMAAALAREAEARQYEELFQEIKKAFQREYVAEDGRIKGETQAGYALALHFDLLPESLREAALRYILEGIERYNGHLSTGFTATHRLILQLSQNGYHDAAWTLVNNRTCPSWGHMIEQGATTMWERWDGYVPGRALSGRVPSDRIQLPLATGFQTSSMTSFNHYAFGSIGEWMYRTLLGVEPDENKPAYKEFTIRPLPGGALTHARGRLRTIRGEICVDWRDEPGRFQLDVTVPPNTTAKLWVPNKSSQPTIVESGHALLAGGSHSGNQVGIAFEGLTPKDARFRLESGSYAFTSQ